MNVGEFFELQKTAKGELRKIPQCKKYKTRRPLQMQGLRVAFYMLWKNERISSLRSLSGFFLFIKYSDYIYACYSAKNQCGSYKL